MKNAFRQIYESSRQDKQPMKPDDFVTIRKIAEQARDKIQEYFWQRRTETDMAVSSSTLGGACAISSFFIQRELKEKGYESRVECVAPQVGGAHCFVVIRGNKNDHILDITATQFNNKKVGNYFPKIVVRRKVSSKKYDKIHMNKPNVAPYESVESDEAWINKMWWKLQTPGYHKELFK